MADNGIKETYVSPIVRLAFAREDHPGLDVKYAVVDAKDSGIHPAFLGDTELFVTCTVTIPGIPPITAWKDVPKTEERWTGQQGSRRKVTVQVELNPDILAVLQTKALGRALKLLGYPDDMVAFRAVILWRQRNREIAAIGERPPVAELEAAVSAIPTATEPDAEPDRPIEEGDVVVTVDEATGEIVVENDATALWTDLLGTMDPRLRVRVAQWAAAQLGVKNIFHVAPADAEKLIDYYEEIAEEGDNEPVSLDA